MDVHVVSARRRSSGPPGLPLQRGVFRALVAPLLPKLRVQVARSRSRKYGVFHARSRCRPLPRAGAVRQRARIQSCRILRRYWWCIASAPVCSSWGSMCICMHLRQGRPPAAARHRSRRDELDDVQRQLRRSCAPHPMLSKAQLSSGAHTRPEAQRTGRRTDTSSHPMV